MKLRTFDLYFRFESHSFIWLRVATLIFPKNFFRITDQICDFGIFDPVYLFKCGLSLISISK